MHKSFPHFLFMQLRTAAVLGCVLISVRSADAAATLNDAVSLVPTNYRHQLVQQLSLAENSQQQWLDTIAKCTPEHRAALAFLLANMPERDLKTMTGDEILHNIDLAYTARAASAWASAIPEEIFFNEVLPYANLNEKRENWRDDFYKRFSPLVKDCKSADEAAQVLNHAVFKEVGVSYNASKRKKPDQSPSESIDCHYASCSGLSIILADACRSVGVPARVTGTALWSNGSGNHTWVEIWDGQWRFTGAAEPNQFNKTWFADLAAKADDTKVEQRIHAASYRKTDEPFLLVWDPESKEYPAVDVTGYYVNRRKVNVNVLDKEGKPSEGTVEIRQGGVLIAQGKGPGVTFELAADKDYAVEIVKAPGHGSAKSFHLPGDHDLDVTVGEGAAPAKAK
ncbi:MAG TPA: transglutaminase-like domain-containing protein [Tepidisphaeraceae bacterium]|jgi:hypothetical protein|nr:transglutaminase-like domain-containing protein [Tepidisphaeraceae bacterium]